MRSGEILLSHLAAQEHVSEYVRIDERHGVCGNRDIDDPDVEPLLVSSGPEARPGDTTAA